MLAESRVVCLVLNKCWARASALRQQVCVCVHVSGRLGRNIHAGGRPMLLLNNYINLMSQV